MTSYHHHLPGTQTQRWPFQRQRPRLQRQGCAPRGRGGGVSGRGGGIGGPPGEGPPGGGGDVIGGPPGGGPPGGEPPGAGGMDAGCPWATTGRAMIANAASILRRCIMESPNRSCTANPSLTGTIHENAQSVGSRLAAQMPPRDKSWPNVYAEPVLGSQVRDGRSLFPRDWRLLCKRPYHCNTLRTIDHHHRHAARRSLALCAGARQKPRRIA